MFKQDGNGIVSYETVLGNVYSRVVEVRKKSVINFARYCRLRRLIESVFQSSRYLSPREEIAEMNGDYVSWGYIARNYDFGTESVLAQIELDAVENELKGMIEDIKNEGKSSESVLTRLLDDIMEAINGYYVNSEITYAQPLK